jgi:hypothetical protein
MLLATSSLMVAAAAQREAALLEAQEPLAAQAGQAARPVTEEQAATLIALA